MANFPTNPSIGDLFETKHDTFKWNGSGWEALGRILTHRQKSGTPYSSLSIKESGGVLDTDDTSTVLLIGEQITEGQVRAAHLSDANTVFLSGETAATGISEFSNDGNTLFLSGEGATAGLEAHTADVATTALVTGERDASNYKMRCSLSNDMVMREGYRFEHEDWISTPSSSDFAFGTGDFTVEFWAYNEDVSNSTQKGLMQISDTAGGIKTSYDTGFILNLGGGIGDGVLRLHDGTQTVATGIGIMKENTWQHVAVSRTSGTAKIFIDGKEEASGSFTADVVGTNLGIGMYYGYNQGGYDYGIIGYMKDIRISKGIGRYTADFTTEITTKDSNHKLILEGKDDISDSGHTVTFHNSAHQVSKTGNKSWHKFGSPLGYIRSYDSISLDGDFTIEWWYLSKETGTQHMFTIGDSQQSSGLEFYQGGDGQKLYTNSGYIWTNGGYVSTNTWYHFAVVRSSGVVKVYRDGTQIGSDWSTNTTFSGRIGVGVEWYGNQAYTNAKEAYYDDFTIHRSAKYTSAFTPSTTAAPIDGLNTLFKATTDYDTSDRMQDIIGFHGNATTIEKGYYYTGNNSSNNILVGNAGTDFNFGSDKFTIEFSVKFDDVSQYMGILKIKHPSESRKYLIIDAPGPNANEGLRLYVNDGSGSNNSWKTYWVAEPNFENDKWYHIAIVRDGTGSGDWYFFINGKEESKWKHPTVAPGDHYALAIPDLTDGIEIGGNSDNYMMVGNITDIRVSKGVARYTSNYSAPVTAIDSDHKLVLSGGAEDESDSAHTITFNGTSDVATKRGDRSLYFDGTGDYVTIPSSSDFALGTGDFTIECWLKYETADTFPYVFDFRDAGAQGVFPTCYLRSDDGYKPVYYVDSAQRITSSVSLTIDTWYHLAISRVSGTTTMYLDGVDVGSFSDSYDYQASPIRLGAYSNGDYELTGYINDFRVSKGTARYTSAFDLESGTGLLDKSSNSHSITLSGNAALSTAEKKFGTHSLYFAADNDYVAITDHSDLQFGADGDFTVECWFKVPNITAYAQYLWIKHDSGAFAKFGMQIQIDGTLRLLAANSSDNAYLALAATSGHAALDDNEWHHCALTRSSGTTKIWVDGTERMSTTDAYNPSFAGHNFNIGGTPLNVYTGLINGYVDDFRISDTARYTSNFYLDAVTYPSDQSSNSHSVTLSGNAALSTAQKKFGTYSLSFDGNGDYVSIADSDDFQLTGDFTIETWVRFNAIQDSWFACQAVNDNNAWAFGYMNSGNGLTFKHAEGSWGSPTILVEGAWTPSTGQWYHVAVTRSGNDFKLFVDGTQVGSTVTDTTAFANFGAPVVLGVWGTGSYSGSPLNGYLDDFRISSSARYTSAFLIEDTKTPLDKKGNHTLTLNGDALITSSGSTGSNENTKFGTGAIYFDGSGDYISTSSMTLDGDFTVEAWIKPTTANLCKLMTIGDIKQTSGFELFRGGGTPSLRVDTGNGTVNSLLIQGSEDVTVNSWQHVAVVRSGSTLTLYKDGVSIGSTTNSATFSGTLIIGGEWFDGALNGSMTGYMDEFRISTSARYTANFTPQSVEHDLIDVKGWGSPVLGSGERALFVNKNGLVMKSSDGTLTKLDTTSIAGRKLKEGDEPAATADTSTLLLLHFEGDNNSQTFVDSSNYGHTVEARIENGTATDVKMVTSNKKIGTSSAYFDGNSEVLRVAGNSAFQLGTGDFTIETWYKQPNDGGEDYVFVLGSTGDWVILASYISGGNVFWGYLNGSSWVDTVTTSGQTVTDNEWHHIAYVRASGTMTIYIDGIARGSVASTHNLTTIMGSEPLWIGGYYGGGNQGPNVYMDEFRFSDTARYTGAFTPSTTAFKVAGKPALYVAAGEDSNTKAALIGDSLTCLTGKTLADTDATVDTSEKHFGDSSLKWQSSQTNFLKYDDHDDFHIGTGDFTIEAWIKPTFGVVEPISFMFDGTTNNRFAFYGQGGKLIFFYVEGGSSQIEFNAGASSFTNNTWQHVAIVRSSGDWSIYVDGVAKSLTFSNGSQGDAPNIQNFDRGMYIGYQYSGSHWYLDANIQNWRFSKTARYTSNFTPSTESFDSGGLIYRDPSGVKTKIS